MQSSDKCHVPDCGKAIRRREWCWQHYRRWALHGDPTRLSLTAYNEKPQRPDGGHCEVAGCASVVDARSMCSMHYRRWKRRGTTTERVIRGNCLRPEYKVWRSMKSRCNNESGRDYGHYGGRGIAVCSSWSASFENFFADMGERPGEKFSIERIDNNGNYCPDNCEWALPLVQANNKRNSAFIEFEGLRQTLPQWCRFLGVSYRCVQGRIRRLGWSFVKAVTTPRRITKLTRI